jgi:hypothetical protein
MLGHSMMAGRLKAFGAKFWSVFSRFTKVDPGNLFAISSFSLTFANLQRNSSNYLYKNFDAGYWAGQIEITFGLKITGISNNNAAFFSLLSNTIEDAAAHQTNYHDCLGVHLYYPGPFSALSLWETDSVTAASYTTDSSSFHLTVNQQYYIRIRIKPDIGPNGTAYLDIFTNSAMTTNVSSQSLALHGSIKAYQNLYAVASYNRGTSATVSGIVTNLVATKS